jgi:peptidoglycan biosynthesis protein MviN/MurJ (putative lipid II flippase)
MEKTGALFPPFVSLFFPRFFDIYLLSVSAEPCISFVQIILFPCLFFIVIWAIGAGVLESVFSFFCQVHLF